MFGFGTEYVGWAFWLPLLWAAILGVALERAATGAGAASADATVQLVLNLYKREPA